MDASRETPDATTEPTCYDLTNMLVGYEEPSASQVTPALGGRLGGRRSDVLKEARTRTTIRTCYRLLGGTTCLIRPRLFYAFSVLPRITIFCYMIRHSGGVRASTTVRECFVGVSISRALLLFIRYHCSDCAYCLCLHGHSNMSQTGSSQTEKLTANGQMVR